MIPATHIKPDEDLRIWDYFESLPFEPVVEFTDFTTIGLVKKPSIYGTGGVKQQQDYTDEFGNWIVRKKFTYTDEGVTIKFEWADSQGEVGLHKTEFKPCNIVEVAKLKRANRERTVLYLQATAKGTPVEAYVNSIFVHYKTEIDLWVYNATDDLKNAIENETEYDEDGEINPIYQYLHLVTRPPTQEYPNGLTVKDGILLQTCCG